MLDRYFLTYVVVKWFTLLIPIRVVPDSNLCRRLAILTEGFRSFSQSIQANA
jgi:hypothetical protein